MTEPNPIDPKFYLVSVAGQPCDSILCGDCLRKAPDLAGVSFVALSVHDFETMLKDGDGAGCEVCGEDYPRANLSDGAWRLWLRDAGETAAGKSIGQSDFDKLAAGVSFRDYLRGRVGHEIRYGSPAQAAREAQECLRWARQILRALGLSEWTAGDVDKVREVGLC